MLNKYKDVEKKNENILEERNYFRKCDFLVYRENENNFVIWLLQLKVDIFMDFEKDNFNGFV